MIDKESLRNFFRGRSATRLIAGREEATEGPFHLALRCQAKLLFSGWFANVPFYETLESALRQCPTAQTIELCLTTGREEIRPQSWQSQTADRRTGRIGLELVHGGYVERLSPLEAIANNNTLQGWFLWHLEHQGLSPEAFFESGGKLTALVMRQMVVSLSPSLEISETYRGNCILRFESADRGLLEDVLQRMSSWFLSNFEESGRLPYSVWPSGGSGVESDNSIRCLAAAVALNRLAAAKADDQMERVAQKNLEFNLGRFYREENGLGLIHSAGSVPLGALALAALAIMESGACERWDRELKALWRTIDKLWQADGSFRTFYLPADRNDNQNFYPGEALLFIACRLQREPDLRTLERAIRSLMWYRGFHARNPHPAFVPWHSQAARALFRLTRRTDIRDYVFELNDWLLPMQQWGGDLEPDLWGRFHDPTRPEFGAPHVSSTGVFMEGLAEALDLAIEAGDTQRASAYELALRRGLRSIAQLQFRDALDAYYVSDLARVLGAIRSDAYNNMIRIDNIQHATMALLKLKDLLAKPLPREGQPAP